MDRVERCGAIATLVLTLALAGCGGGGGSSTTSSGASSGGGGATTQSVQGVATPSSVSVVTAKNAQ